MTTPLLLGITGSVSVGLNLGSPVTPDYTPPFTFTGTLYNVTIDVSGDLHKDNEADMRKILAHQ